MRRCIALGGVFLILFALALPAQAGLGDLLGEVLDNPVQDLTAPLAPMVTTFPIVSDLTESVDAVVAPVLTVVDDVASPVVAVVDEVAEPLVDLVEPVVGDDDLVPGVPVEPVTPPSVLPELAGGPRVTSASASLDEPISNQVPTVGVPQEATAVRMSQLDSIQRLLLTTINRPTISVVEREGSNAGIGAPIGIAAWLTALGAWLGSGISGLLDVLAIPIRLLELLLRALTSAGAGLVAPAAVLGALAVGGRRRLLPVK